MTDQNGQYKFSDLQPGHVHRARSAAGRATSSSATPSARPAARCVGLDTIAGATLGSGVNATDYDFCVQPPASIAGMIHVDLNGDCIYEPGEPLLAGVTVQLLDCARTRSSPPP